MSLLEIAQEIKKSGFDARKDSANGQEKIPAGSYPVLLRSASFNIAKSGWEMLRYEFDIQEGDQAGRTELAQFGTLEEWNGKNIKWAVERTTKFFQKAIVLSGDEVLISDFEDGPSLMEALQRKAVGSYYILNIEESTSKGKTYRSYDLEEMPGAEVASKANGIEINDDDLPF